MGQHTLRPFAGGTKPGGEAHAPEGGAAKQRGLDRLERGAGRNLVQFTKGKSQVLHPGRNKPLHQYMLGETQPDTWGHSRPHAD